MSAVTSIREKLRRKVSMHDKEPNLDEHDEADDETTGNLHRDIEEAETAGHENGRPGSFLHRLISHGNKKTEDDIRREAAAANNSSGATSGAAH